MRRLALLKAGQRRQVASGIMVYSLVAGEVPAFRAVEEWTQAAALGPIDVMPVQVLLPCRPPHARRVIAAGWVITAMGVQSHALVPAHWTYADSKHSRV